MFPHDPNSLTQRQVLGRICCDRDIESGVADHDARRSGDNPPDMLVVPVPKFDANPKMARDVVEVRIG